MTDQTWEAEDTIPLHKFLGIRLDRTRLPRGRAMLELTESVRGAVAPVHGGVLASLGDVACGFTLEGQFDPTVEFPVSTDVHIRYYGQPRKSPLIAEAEIVHRGSRLIGAECVIRDGDGRQVARVTGTYMIIRGFGDLAQKPPASDS